MIQAALHHPVAAILALLGAGGTSIGAMALAWLKIKAPAAIKTEEGKLIASAMGKLSRPEDKAALKAVLAAIQARMPDAGSSLFPQTADAMIAKVPSLAPYRQALIDLMVAVEQAAKEGAVQP